jgi:succinate dehydrogenase/fumarate reductase flavoprotein subunit
MKIFPGMHYTMGGLWVDFNQATNIPEFMRRASANINITARTAGREFAGLVHLRRIRRRTNAVKYARGLQALPTATDISTPKEAAGREQFPADEVGGHGESIPAVARTRAS